MTSIPSNLGPAVTLGQDVIKPSRQTAEERQLFEEARIRGEEQALQREENTQAVINGAEELVISYAEFPHADDPHHHPTYSERVASYKEYYDLMYGDLPDLTKRANQSLERVEKVIQYDMPSLNNKRWDFSINGNNDFVVKGSDLTANEKDLITNQLSESGLTHIYMKLRDTMINSLVAERGTNRYSTSIGKYDLTKETFSGTIFFREYKGMLSKAPESGALMELSFAQQLAARAEEKYNELDIKYVDEYA